MDKNVSVFMSQGKFLQYLKLAGSNQWHPVGKEPG